MAKMEPEGFDVTKRIETISGPDGSRIIRLSALINRAGTFSDIYVSPSMVSQINFVDDEESEVKIGPSIGIRVFRQFATIAHEVSGCPDPNQSIILTGKDGTRFILVTTRRRYKSDKTFVKYINVDFIQCVEEISDTECRLHIQGSDPDYNVVDLPARQFSEMMVGIL